MVSYDVLWTILGSIFGGLVTIVGLVYLGIRLGDMFISEKKFSKHTEHVDARFDEIDQKISNMREAILALAHAFDTGHLPEDFKKKYSEGDSK